MGNNIWGKGGLFEQRLAQKMGTEQTRTGILQQEADSSQAYREGTIENNAFQADTNRIKSGNDGGDPEALGLRQLGKGSPSDILDEDGSVMGIRGSKFGTSRTRPQASSPISNSFVRETQDSAGEETENSLYRKGGPVGLRGYQNGGQVHRMPRGLPRVVDDRKAVRGPSTVPPDNTGTPQTDKEAARAKQRDEAAVDEGMRRGAENHKNRKLYAKGGAITSSAQRKKRKAIGQPGYNAGGAIKLPPEPQGPIGDVAQDTGEDTETIGARPGEYLLNPNTVRDGFGQGDYEAGVRNLNQIVLAATGEEPGPEPVGKPGEEAKRGFANSGGLFYTDEFGQVKKGQPGVPLRNATPQVTGTQPVTQPLSAGQAAGQTPRPAPDRIGVGPEIRAELKAAPTAEASGPPKPRGIRFEQFGERAGASTRQAFGSAKEIAKKVGGNTLAGGLEVVRQLGDKQKNQYYNDPDVANTEKALQTGSDIVDSGLRLGGGFLGAPIGQAAIPIPIVGGAAGFAGGYMAGDAVWEGDNDALRAYREANPVDVGGGMDPRVASMTAGEYANEFADSLELTPDQAPQEFTDPQGKTITEGSPAAPIRQSDDQMIANYLANNGQDADTFGENPVNAGNLRQIPGTDTQYAGRYDGQEVTVQEGKYGEPVFTGNRTPEEIAASTARSNQEQAPPTYEDGLRSQIQAIQNGAPGGTDMLDRLQRELGATERAKIAAASRATTAPMTPGEISQDMLKSIDPLFPPSVNPETGEKISNDGAKAQFLQDLPADSNFWGASAGDRTQMVRAWMMDVQQKQRIQKGLGETGSDRFNDLRLTPGRGDMPIQGETREAGFMDVFGDNNNYGIGDAFSDLSPFSDNDMLTEYTIPGINGTARLKTNDLINDQQQGLREMQRQDALRRQR
jgi:hypothetical protein